ncbi:head-tail adaptor protein [uncultured Roseobacter sp.]|uniref:head-tail adaptor protein n=1 Tax=uncultured Roseobacter sp. TaxID=114847 RepID=UPI002629283F|nr:head-tail adaptor protein [uncultured Roseobacter sp.]
MAGKALQRRLDWRVQFQRAARVDDGFSVNQEFADHGDPIWAEKVDVSDGERLKSAEVAAHVSTRFTVHWSTFTSQVTPKDRLICEGREYNIVGIKETGRRRRWIEISALARTDT